MTIQQMNGYEVCKLLLFTFLISLCNSLACDSVTGADDWKTKLFTTTKHDFGTVARGSKSIHRFVIKNPFDKPIVISSVRSSCGCTKASFTNKQIAALGEGEIVADFNTRSFLGKKNATITVSFQQPFRAEVQLIVSGYIRSDIVFDPGAVNFQNVNAGASRTIKTIINYAGSKAWKILDIQSGCKYLTAELKEIERKSNSVKYELTTTLLGSAPSGHLQTDLLIITNDQRSNRVPLAVVAKIASPLSISPSQIEIPNLQSGLVKKTKLILRGADTFRITAVKCDDPRVEVQVAPAEKKIHFATITFTAVNQADLPKEFSILFQTDSKSASTVTVPVVVR